MLITLRLPRSSALKLNLPIAGTEQHDVIVTLTAVELAGRLSLATGKAIGPEAVVHYCLAWRAAAKALQRLIADHGRPGLAAMLRRPCNERALWTPSGTAAMLKWLRCVLESHFLSQAGSQGSRPEGPSSGQPTDTDLAAICKAVFPQAYVLWLASEVSPRVGNATSVADECLALPAEERRLL